MPALVLALAAAGIAVWFAVPRIQVMRADAKLVAANDAIAAANEQLSGIDLTTIGTESFVSVASIRATSETLNATLPVIDEAIEEVEAALEAIDAASGLYRLPESYVAYLAVKRETAELRIEQMEALRDLIDEAQPLYEHGDVIFTAIEEMDRLWGQVDYHMRTLQNDPAGARAGLQQAADTMYGLKEQLDSRGAESDFGLIELLSESVGENAKLAELARDLADAVGSGDQARVQQAAAAMEAQLLETTDTSGFIDVWVEYEIESEVSDFEVLQDEQEELDVEAAALFPGRY